MSSTAGADRRRRRALRRQAVAGVAAVAVLGSGGTAAFAAYTVSGTSPTAGQAASLGRQDVTLSLPTAAVTADLYPGASGKVRFKVTNPNAYPVKITGVTFGTVSSSDAAACPSSNITTANQSGLNIAVPANNGTADVETDGVSMLLAAADGCAGRTFSIQVTVTGTST